MIGWLLPAALAGLALIALPIVVHLLRTHRAQRIPFPTLRFIAPSRTSAVKLRLPSDIPLLLIRVAIVSAASLAMVQPVLLTDARVKVWNSRLIRAVVVDASDAMQIADDAGTKPVDLVKPLADSETAGAMQAIRIDTSSLGDGLTRAAAWLATAPPARREIVVISTFRAGALAESTLSEVPSSIGLRLVQVGGAVGSRAVAGIQPLTAIGGLSAVQDVQLTGAKTTVIRRAAPDEQRGWRVAGFDANAPEVQRLWRTVAVAGAAAPSAEEPISIAFGEWPSRETVVPLSDDVPRWMLQTLVRLRADDGLRRAAASARPSTLSAADGWVNVCVDADGAPLARVARASRQLAMQVGAPIDSLFGAAAARAMLDARAGDSARPDQEILRVPAATLAGWSRPAPPIDRGAWRSLDGSDARWLWALALGLLAAEHWLRRWSRPQTVEVRHAA